MVDLVVSAKMVSIVFQTKQMANVKLVFVILAELTVTHATKQLVTYFDNFISNRPFHLFVSLLSMRSCYALMLELPSKASKHTPC